METVFGTSFEYKLIYVFAINDEAHKGLLKIGDTTIQDVYKRQAQAPERSGTMKGAAYEGYCSQRAKRT